MTEDAHLDKARSIDTVIQGFTDAELALREVTGAVDRIRSASDKLDEARADQVAAREALGETVAAIHQLGEKVEGVVDGLRNAVEVLTALDPGRLWRHLDDHTAAIRAATDKSTSDLAAALNRLEGRVDASDEKSAALMTDAVGRAESRADEIQAAERRTRWVVVAVLGIALADLGVVLAMTVGWLRFP